MNRHAVVTSLLAALALGIGATAQPRDPLATPRRPAPTLTDSDEQLLELVEGAAFTVQSYREVKPGEPPKKVERGGGLAGAMDWVANQIGAMGTADSRGSARLRLKLTPVIKPDRETYRVKIKADELQWDVGPELEPASRAAVERDRAKVLAALMRFEVVLSPEQAKDLREHKPLSVGVREPFRGMSKLSPASPVVTLVLPTEDELEVVDIRFLAITKGGLRPVSRLAYGVASIAEVTLNKPPEREPVTVKIATPDGSITLNCSGPPDSATLRTPAFMVVLPAALEGLDAPATPVRPGDELIRIP